MKDHEVDSVLGQWAEISAKAAQIASAEHRRRVRRPTSLGLSISAVTIIAVVVAGGTTFTLANPTRNPDLLDLTFLGAPGADAEAHADFSRAALVFANHPKVRGASEASRAYLIAPVASGVWQIWIVR